MSGCKILKVSSERSATVILSFNFKVETSANRKSGKFLGIALTVSFLLFLESKPPLSLTPGAVPSTLTGIVILISFPGCNWKKSTCKILSETGWN